MNESINCPACHQQSIQTALTGFFDLSTGGSDGTGVGFAEQILLKDIHALISDIDGIERFEIKRLTYRPRIDENIVGLTTDYQSSEVTIFPTVSESEWMIGASGPRLSRTASSSAKSRPGLIFTLILRYPSSSAAEALATRESMSG